MTKDRAMKKAIKYLEWAELADNKRTELRQAFDEKYKHFDWTQPILIGHHSQRRHERVFEEQDHFYKTQFELIEKAKRFREKAENLIAFADRNKGDAERKREEVRAERDSMIAEGTNIYDPCYGQGEMVKVNKKTYTIAFVSGFKTTRDKSFVKPLQAS